jgi:phosphoribosylformylglycinamidine synthase
MNYEVFVNIMPHQGLLDPQGKAVHQGLNKIGINKVNDVRIGKKIVLHVEASN